jgi:hypothetical protein
MIARLMILIMLAAATGNAHPGSAIAVSKDGVVYLVDTGAGVFAIQPGEEVRHLEGPAFHWFAFDPDSRFRNTSWPNIPGAEFHSAGMFVLSSDFPVTIADATFYYPDGTQGGRVRIVAIDPSGQTSVRATLPPVRSGGQEITWINGLTPGADGSLFYTEDRAIRKVDRRGHVSTVVANVVVKDCAAVPGVEASQGPYLRGLAVAADGSIYVAAAGCAAVLKVDPNGRFGTVLRSSPPWSPTAVAIGGRDVYVLEYLHTASEIRREWIPRVRKISAAGEVTIIRSSRTR